MKIGILQTGIVLEELARLHGQYPEMFVKLLAGHDFSFETWNVVEGELPATCRESDGWLVTGSRHAVYEELAWITPLEEFLRRCIEASIPVVGICFGHQILAQALGGKVEKHEGGWTVGRHAYQIGNETLYVNSWNQDQVVSSPGGAQLIGTSDSCHFAMLSYGDRALSCQFHPEFDDSFMADMIEIRGVGLVPPNLLQTARDNLGQPMHNGRIADMIAQVYRSSDQCSKVQPSTFA